MDKWVRLNAELADARHYANDVKAENDALKAQQAKAVQLLDSCLGFLDTLDTDDWPAGLDFAIRHFKRQLAGEISWDETPGQTMNRELDAWIRDTTADGIVIPDDGSDE